MISNPYLEKYGLRAKEPDFTNYGQREKCIAKYSWAIPGQNALNTIASYGPIVEMGAGSGYWAYCLRQMGVDVIAYDHKEKWYPGEGDSTHWSEVLLGTPEHLKDHGDRSLLLVWPPYSTSMAYDCLNYYTGNTVLYVGEGDGGCTADDGFHATLSREWELEGTVEIPQWWGLYDILGVWRRK